MVNMDIIHRIDTNVQGEEKAIVEVSDAETFQTKFRAIDAVFFTPNMSSFTDEIFGFTLNGQFVDISIVGTDTTDVRGVITVYGRE